MLVFKAISTIIIAVLFFPISPAHSRPKESVIYGDDNRVDVYESENSIFVELSKSTAAQIAPENIVTTRQDARSEIRAKRLQEQGICKEERFVEQIAAARCSGFLVGKDMLVTAGHCIRDQYDCDNYFWVFDYKVSSQEPKVGVIKVRTQNIYKCKEIISQSLDYTTMDDYALIRLNRKVNDRQPLSYRQKGKVEVGDPLVVIGHPSGLPTKIADGASVRSNDEDQYFVANLDTYGGNSGSAVFNTETGMVEGILVRGEHDYEMSPGKSCKISKMCEENGCRGEDVTRITNIKELRD